MRPVELVISKLRGIRRSGKKWVALCPAHDDQHPSLSLSEGEDGRALLKCHAGCDLKSIVAAIGLTMSDLFVSGGGNSSAGPTNGSERDPGQESNIDWNAEADRCTAALSNEQRDDLARELGVSSAALAAVGVGLAESEDLRRWQAGGRGWNENYPEFAYTFPERDAAGQIVGLSIRAPDGRKGFPSGASRGLVLPSTLGERPGPKLCVEGPTDVAALETLGIPSIGRSSAASGAAIVSAIMRGQQLIVVGENDLKADGNWPGREGARKVAKKIAEAWGEPVEWCLPPASIKDIRAWLRLQIENGLDITDPTAVQAAGRRLLVLLRESATEETATRGDSTPCQRVPKYIPFPVHLLPEPLRSFIDRASEAIGCDPAFIALPLLAAAASAIGNTRRLRLKRGWAEPAIIWALVVAPSGTQKSPALGVIHRAIEELQRRALMDHDEELKRYKAKVYAYDVRRAAWVKKGGAGDPPEEPDKPVPERLYCSDTTIEALAPLLKDRWRGILLIRDELSGWLEGFNQYRNGKGGDVAHWLEMHGGRPSLIDRKTGNPKTIHIPCASVSIAGGIQPQVLARALGSKYFENGLAARFLLAYPPRTHRRWTESDIPEECESELLRIFERLYSLREDKSQDGQPIPRDVDLAPEAKRIWIEFFNEHGEEQFAMTGDLAAAWSKLEGYAARLALVIHYLRWAGGNATDDPRVDEESIKSGIELSRWFGNEAKGVYTILRETERQRELREFTDVIRNRGGTVTVREWQRIRTHPTSVMAETELQRLVDAEHGAWEYPKPSAQGGRPTKVFRLKEPGSESETPNENQRERVSSVSEDERESDSGQGSGSASRGDRGEHDVWSDETPSPVQDKGVQSESEYGVPDRGEDGSGEVPHSTASAGISPRQLRDSAEASDTDRTPSGESVAEVFSGDPGFEGFLDLLEQTFGELESAANARASPSTCAPSLSEPATQSDRPQDGAKPPGLLFEDADDSEVGYD